ncbi:MAG: hypothetical protein QGI86_19630 [Candidatus Poribacteria bacterium]|jgi:hypothetical protein|nr:hypothetical protein [Candidatus Poribacteria bacterium]MDP6997583.1 hypothetical protein [Candidatus Poribacteria bacterium]
MKKKIALSLMLVLIFGLTTTVLSQTYFEDNFDDAKKSDKKWNPLFGQWDLKDKEYIQSLQLVNSMSLVTDEFWKEEWNNYTFEVKGNKIGGAEGFLIMFRCRGMMQPRGQALLKHPGRMQKQKPSLEYWWNLGGWGNTRSKVESWGGVGGADSKHTIKDDTWYEIKIVNTPKDYTLFLDGKEVAKVKDGTQDGVGRIGLATWATKARYDNVIVYGPDGPSAPVKANSKVALTWGHLKTHN